ncbi:MAG: response regulator [Defluviitaleaceae bacterium]|nr:response regulator [Defluviitaleaceae bacterium]
MSSLVNGDYYHFVPGLMVPRNVSFEKVDAAINKLIQIAPDISERLEAELINKHYMNMKADLELLIPILQDIYARSLEINIMRLIRMLEDFTWEGQIPKATRAVISDLNSLSIEMQSGQRFGTDKKAKSESTAIEMYADRLNILSSLNKLIREGSVYQATCLIEDMAKHNHDAIFYELMEFAKQRDFKGLSAAVRKLIKTHIAAIRQNAGTDLSKKILAVDDMPEIVSFVSSALKSHYKVFGAQNGKTAIKIMAAQKPDLFILDIDMPVMDGFELAETIRNSAYHADTPIIFLTGNSSRERFERAIKLRANDFIVKPTTHEALLTKVGKYLNRG